MFVDVVGQERAVETLRHAAERPSHAYLLVGPRGSGVEDAAREFAALLIGVGDDERGLRLVQRGVHPDVVEFAPGGASYRVKEDVRDAILPEAARAPIEADRRVLILFEAERLRGNQNESANAMLKTIEEPPPRTIVMLVTAAADDLLPTIRSRCQRIDFDPVADDDARAPRSNATASSREIAETAAALSGGQLARARAFAGPLAPMRDGVRRRRRAASTVRARPRSRSPNNSAQRSTRRPTRSRAATTTSCASSTPSSNGSATRNATRSGSGGGSRSGTSASRAARGSICCSKA